MARKRCVDCEYRYAKGRSPRCDICRKRRQGRQRHDAHLQATYGITIQDYDAMLALQGGTCAICDGGTSKRYFATDHNHRTGEVRGLLCANCNKALGRFRDDPGRFRRAADYLEDPPSRTTLSKRDWSQYADNSEKPSRGGHRW